MIIYSLLLHKLRSRISSLKSFIFNKYILFFILGQLRDYEWRLDQEATLYHKSNEQKKSLQRDINRVKAVKPTNQLQPLNKKGSKPNNATAAKNTTKGQTTKAKASTSKVKARPKSELNKIPESRE